MLSNLNEKNLEKKITPRAEDYSQWYLDIISAADLADYGPVKGTMVIKPYGYAIWEATQKILDEKFKETGVQNAYFPMLIPERLLKREESHIEGFAPEVAVVTHAGGKKLDEPLIVRPTSETIMYEVFSTWIRSYRDLPLLINQWANVIRWEMRTRLFLRTTEFLWQEGHTVHETHDEAEKRSLMMLEIYRDFAENYMAIPVILGVKTESEKFAGALHTYCCEAMMQDGKALQFATSHDLGQNFAKVFNVKFIDQNNVEQFGWQTSWGLSTRTIGGLIMTHSDDKGLVLPPKIASIQVVITTITPNEESKDVIPEKAHVLAKALSDVGVRTHVDDRDIRPGEKYFEWEKKGVPVRIELGPKDVANNVAMLVRRDTGFKKSVPLADLEKEVIALLEEIQKNLFDTALKYQKEKTVSVDNWDEFVKAIEEGKFVLAHWSGEADVEVKIKEETLATIRCIPFNQPEEKGVCIKSGKPSTKRVLFAKAY
ncbi:MAG: proline--tRNA ligase [Candidatus Paceibacterota bacterium]|jgi:prolyl-tRNA synthetase